jgi:hypothetical protein
MLLPFGSSMNLSNAMAIADYGNTDQYTKYAQDMTENNYYKSQNNEILQKIKCNNINSNLNNVDANFGSPIPSDGTEGGNDRESLAAQDEIGWTNDDRKYTDRENKFSVVCINNNKNNNTVVGGGEEEPISELCEECFATNSTLHAAILDFLAEFDDVLVFSTSTGEEGQGDGFIIGPQTDTIEQLCAQIKNAVEDFGIPLSDLLLESVFDSMFTDHETGSNPYEDGIDDLIECLLEAGLIIHVEIPPGSISANGLSNPNIQCTGSPLCAKLEQQ